MNGSNVEKRRAILINVAFLVAVFYLVFKTFFGVLVPFIVAFIVSALLQKPVRFIERKTPIKRSLASPVCVLLLVVVICSVIFLLGMTIVDKVKGFLDYVAERFRNIPELLGDVELWVLKIADSLPAAIGTKLSESATAVFDNLIKYSAGKVTFDTLIETFNGEWASVVSGGGSFVSSAISKGGNLVGGLLKGTVSRIPSVAIGVVISIIATAFMTADFDIIKKFLIRQLSDENAKRLTDACGIATSTLKKMLKAYGLIILITFSELLIGFYILKFIGILHAAYIPAIALAIAIIDIIPVLGTGTVLIPWAVYSLITGKISMGIGLIILYVIILIIRQAIEPRLVAGQVGLPPIVTIIAMYIGTKTLGVFGFFILPFVVILVKEFNDRGIIHLFKNVAADGADDTVVNKSEALPEENTAGQTEENV